MTRWLANPLITFIGTVIAIITVGASLLAYHSNIKNWRVLLSDEWLLSLLNYLAVAFAMWIVYNLAKDIVSKHEGKGSGLSPLRFYAQWVLTSGVLCWLGLIGSRGELQPLAFGLKAYAVLLIAGLIGTRDGLKKGFSKSAQPSDARSANEPTAGQHFYDDFGGNG